MCIFVRLIVAHLLSDIPLNRFALEKRDGSLARRLGIVGLHTAIVFFMTLLFLVDMLNTTVLSCVLVVAGAHFLIDVLRLRVEKWVVTGPIEDTAYSKREDFRQLWRFFKEPGAAWSDGYFREWFMMNAMDQSLHLLVLVLAAAYLSRVL
jgi:hypothetical protein